MNVEEFLRKNKVKYNKLHHPEAFTAQETAAAAHVPGKMLAKAVVVRVGDTYALAVCPASHRVDLKRLSELAGSKVRLANEGEMEEGFADTPLGAEPPFGNLYGLETYVDESLAENDEIAFHAGSHTDLLRISYADFEKLVKPKKGGFASHL